ncbi:MAG: hypothetical protein LBV06_08365 [Propionibacteriaceae bacterium]|jgi:hypothetical protein|nr:hypothetical protein [Propionibacteriaceae bacterium]
MGVIRINGKPLDGVQILEGVSLDPPEPVVSWAAIPGGLDVDTSTLLTAGVPRYGHRSVTLPCMVVGETLWAAQRRLGAQLSGKWVELGFEDRPGWHLSGRANVSDWSWPGRHEAVLFTLGVDAEPYWWKDTATTVKVTGAASPGAAFSLPPTGYPVMPRITVTGSTVTIVKGSQKISLPVGVTSWVDGMLLMPEAPAVAGRIVGTGTVEFFWQEGWPT